MFILNQQIAKLQVHLYHSYLQMIEELIRRIFTLFLFSFFVLNIHETFATGR